MNAAPRLLDAAVVAADLGITLPRLRHMAERGDYPELLRVSRGVYRVRKTDHDAWEQARWTKAEQARANMDWELAKDALLRGEVV